MCIIFGRRLLKGMSNLQIQMKELVHLKKKGVHLYIDPTSPNWISTNMSGSEVVENLKHSSLEDAALKLSMREGIDFPDALRDCKVFSEELIEKGLLIGKLGHNPRYPGRSKVIECGQLQELWIYTNNSCNLRCKHCFISAGEINKDEMSTDQIKALVDEAEGLGVFRFYFTGGEPFLRKDVFELIEYILRTNKNELIILSNGTLFGEGRLKKLKKFKNRNLTLQVSLDGPNPDINDATRGKGSFVKALDGIKGLIKIGMTPIVTTAITNVNVEHVGEITELIASLGVKDQHILWLQNSGRASKNPEGLTVPPEKVTEVMRQLIKKSKKLGIIVDNEMSLRVRSQAKRGRKHDLCNSCFEMISVDSDGHVYPCAPLNGEEGFDCGSIKESSLKDIWRNSQKTRQIRANNVSNKDGCRDCNIRFICGGGCFCQSFYASKALGKGDISAKDPYCSTHKSLIYDVIWELATPDDYKKSNNGYEPPKVLATMDSKLPTCSIPSTIVTDFSFETGTFHCACVLAIDTEGEGNIFKSDGHRLARDACFNELAHEYEEWLDSPIGSTYDGLAKRGVFSLSDIKGGDNILDVGCGTGNYALELAQKGAKVFGVDNSEWMLRIAIKNAVERGVTIDHKHASLEELPFPDASFDVVLCMNVLEFSASPRKAVSEMFRVLKNDGHLIVGVLNKKSLWGFTQRLKKTFAKGAYYEARFFSPKELEELLRLKHNGLNLSTTIFFPPINHKGLLNASKFFEKVGQKILPRSGALIIAKARKTN
jgi:radical SAM protein with 4Fe4S-binding SPASM domain